MVFGILITLSIVVNISLFFAVKRFAERSLQYDATLEDITDDLEIFIEYADSLLQKKIFSMSPEIITFTQNLRDMRKRLDDHIVTHFMNNMKQRKKRVPKLQNSSKQQTERN